MHRFLRIVVLGSTVATLAPAATLTAQATDPVIGTWQMNAAKSKWEPGPAPKTLTATFAAAGQGITVTTQGVDGDGNPVSTSYTGNYDGKDYPLTGSPDYDAIVLKRINASTVTITRKKSGKVVQTVTRVLSPDGKVLTTTTKGTDAKGRTINNVTVYDRQ